jgi:hypothetical protein
MMIKGVSLEFASTPNLVTSEKWESSSEEERIKEINSLIKNFPGYENIEIINAHNDGQVSLGLNVVMAANERGVFLLDFEEWIKKNIDIGISIWHEPIGDKNSLRNLRGIEVTINEEL